MRIGGLQKFSLIDYPKKVAAVIFTQGCNFRCPFCYNPDLVLPEKYIDPLSAEEVLMFLEKRKGQLTGVVVTGGEPTIQRNLAGFLAKIKGLGYAIKLDTNGNEKHRSHH
ncbi:MAG: radical SAM protein [Candidatus Omnitrophica bacterium]|nr:radical SAM protein [Candidatus Omnitrophota bacterium]